MFYIHRISPSSWRVEGESGYEIIGCHLWYEEEEDCTVCNRQMYSGLCFFKLYFYFPALVVYELTMLKLKKKKEEHVQQKLSTNSSTYI